MHAFRPTPAHLLAAMLFVLMLIYPIPHTIAFRNIVLVAFLSGCAVPLYRAGRTAVGEHLARVGVAGWLMLTLTAWLLFQSALISGRPLQALNMLRGDWVIGIIAATAGFVSVMATRVRGYAPGPTPLLRALTLAMFAHIALLLAYQTWVWLAQGHFPFAHTPFAEKDYHSVVVTALLGLLLADLIARLLRGEGALGLPARVELAMALAACVAAVTLSSRNAVIIAVCLVALSAALLLRLGRARLGRGLRPAVAVLALFVAALAWWGVRSDARWANFAESAAVAVQTEAHLAWLEPGVFPWPKTASGAPVEESAYLRIAWAKVAIEQIARHPLGLGYGHKAFGWAVNDAYRVQTGHESSHSGLLDFTLANGLPGIALWLALSAALARIGCRAYHRSGSAAGLMLAFTVIAYFLRCVLDGHLSGFRLEMYGLLVGALLAALPAETAGARRPA